MFLPHLLQERETPLFGNLESPKIRRESQNDVFVCAKQSIQYNSEWDGTTKNQGVRDKQKSGQLSKFWRANMFLFILLLSWVMGTVMSTNPSSKNTVL